MVPVGLLLAGLTFPGRGRAGVTRLYVMLAASSQMRVSRPRTLRTPREPSTVFTVFPFQAGGLYGQLALRSCNSRSMRTIRGKQHRTAMSTITVAKLIAACTQAPWLKWYQYVGMPTRMLRTTVIHTTQMARGVFFTGALPGSNR